MSENNHKISDLSGDKAQTAAELRFVIESLETLAEHKRSPIQRIIDLGRRIVAACLPTHSNCKLPKQKDSPQHRLIDAIAVIKNHYLKYENPSSKSVSKAMVQTASVVTGTTASQRISALYTAPWHASKPAEGLATPNELDLFRVKAISLIRGQSSRTASLKEALEAIRQTPILQATIPGSSQQGLITLRQTIRLFPDCFVLEGSFQRNAHSKIASIPLPNSFHLAMSSQTGHPLPMQHHGWALPNRLFFQPDNLIETPTLKWLSDKQIQIVQELRAGGLLAEQAKQLLTLKQTIFKQSRKNYLYLHRKLVEEIAIAGGGDVAQSTILAYFDWLEKQQDEFEQLSQLYQLLNDTFLSDPDGFENRSDSHWLEAQERHPARDYLVDMGLLLARGWRQPDTLFGRQLLHAFFLQVWNFIEELHLEVDEALISQRLLTSLQRDIECFRTDPLTQAVTGPQRSVRELIAARKT